MNTFGLKLAEYTVESLFNGNIILRQPATGYRYTIDPLLLCSHATPKKDEKILDIGCGCGIIPLILGYNYPHTQITAIEIQKELAEIAQSNMAANHLEHRIQVIHQDISHLTASDTGHKFNLIVSNPPYKKANTGRLNPNPQKAIARHEVKLTITALVQKADDLLKPNGKFMIIFPAERLSDIYCAMQSTAIHPAWIRFIHPSPHKNAIRVIFCGVKQNRSSCKILPPLNLHDTQGNPTQDHKNIFYA